MANKGVDNNGAAEQEQNLELRRALNNAYAFVEGQKLVQSFSAITFEELLDEQVERIEGVSTIQKPNAIDRINKTEQDVIAAVAKIKKLPDDTFKRSSQQSNVNTP